MKQRDHKTTRDSTVPLNDIDNVVMKIELTPDVKLKSITLKDDGSGNSIFANSGTDLIEALGTGVLNNTHVVVNYDDLVPGTENVQVQCSALDAVTNGGVKLEFANDEDNPTLLLADVDELPSIKLVFGAFLEITTTIQYTAAEATAVAITAVIGLEYQQYNTNIDFSINASAYNDEIKQDFDDYFKETTQLLAPITQIQLSDFVQGVYNWSPTSTPPNKNTHPYISCRLNTDDNDALDEWNSTRPWNKFEVTCTNLSIHNSDSDPNSASFDATSQLFDMSDVNDDLKSASEGNGATTVDFAPTDSEGNPISIDASYKIRRFFSSSATPKINKVNFLQQLFASTNGSLSQEYTITFEITATKPGRSYAVRTQTEMPGKLTINVRGMFTSVVMVLIALTTTVVGVVYRRMKLKALLQ